MSTFIENDEEEDARYQEQLYKQRTEFDDEGILNRAGDPHFENNGRENGFYDDLDLDFDENMVEGFIMIGLVATLLVLVYVRQQRNRQRAAGADNAAGGGGGGGDNPGAGGGGNNGDRGFFPRPGEPEFAQWLAGGIGH